ncbi:MAG: T9SS type A sorting domain-containing protein [Schleiferiaceae bacterium]|jgi:hypothetical protein|nr:T9SS type A sorting domain-containing protein [Schleiferiaceae bacterium]
MKEKLLLFSFACSMLAFGQGHNITFQVDMNNYTGTFNTPEVNGDFNGWCGNCAAMTDVNGDNVWEITVNNLSDSIEYKFSYDNWGGQEMLQQGIPCTKTTSGFTNRFMIITGDTVLPPVCWEACQTCSGTPATANVTFKVDLSDYTGSYTDVHLNGTFNNWCGTCAPMSSPNNDSIYELTVAVPTDTIEFKFTLDGWTTQENLTQGSPCTITTMDPNGTFTNRYMMPSADTTLPAVCWESCATCSTIGIDEEWIEDLVIYPNPSNGEVFIKGTIESRTLYDIELMDISGKRVYSTQVENSSIDIKIDLNEFENGVYFITLSSKNGVSTRRLVLSK